MQVTMCDACEVVIKDGDKAEYGVKLLNAIGEEFIVDLCSECYSEVLRYFSPIQNSKELAR